ncbi:hypothetical protein HMPREF1487_09471 [Pseudomonas sp. HPB0071]|uniref:hypothetical protein n=1 Tax=unclassified Pseudomonas TaxID=196821 RepID=UPI0002CC4EC9|nr:MULTISPECIES: hypothetical protein [unclassified Pseudomonas]ENA26992.1 hypothetical protein HMPREF1487_09471 [Pseudomonas sp. HPB0071]
MHNDQRSPHPQYNFEEEVNVEQFSREVHEVAQQSAHEKHHSQNNYHDQEQARAGITDHGHHNQHIGGYASSSFTDEQISLDEIDRNLQQGIDHDAADVKSSNKSKFGLYIALAVIGFLIVMGGFLFVAYKVLVPSTNQPQHSTLIDYNAGASSANDTVNSFGKTLGVSADDIGGDSLPTRPVQRESQTDFQLEASSQSSSPNAVPKTEPLIVNSGISDAPSAAAKTEPQQIVSSNTASAGVAVSDEDAAYDSLVGQLASSDLPIGAIKIDENAIQNQVANKQIGEMKNEITKTRNDITEVRSAISTITDQMKQIGEVIDRNNSSQEELSKQIADLKKTTADTSASLEQLKKSSQVASMNTSQRNSRESKEADRIVKAAEQELTKTSKLEAKKVESQNDKPSMTVKPVPERPKLAAVPVQKPVPENKQTLPAQCDGRMVSANWRLKGVNASAAYVVRVQDQQGLLIKPGVSVPGFGDVISFDPVNRVVCTTQGLIKR